MRDQMGTFRVDVEVENPMRPGSRQLLRSVLVDTGAELSWFPAEVLESLGIERRKRSQFRQADGTVLARWTGAASVYLAGVWTVDEIVFGEPGDVVILGSRSLEGLNLRIDPVRKQLVDAGPAPAAVIAQEERARSASRARFGFRQIVRSVTRGATNVPDRQQPQGVGTGPPRFPCLLSGG